MKILLDAMRFAYLRLDTVILTRTLDEQAQCRLIEARDTLAEAAAYVMGGDEAQKFFTAGDGYRRIDPPHAPEELRHEG